MHGLVYHEVPVPLVMLHKCPGTEMSMCFLAYSTSVQPLLLAELQLINLEQIARARDRLTIPNLRPPNLDIRRMHTLTFLSTLIFVPVYIIHILNMFICFILDAGVDSFDLRRSTIPDHSVRFIIFSQLISNVVFISGGGKIVPCFN